MMFQAVLSNRTHPEYGVATIPFPVPHDQYAHCMELLEALEIGDALKADSKVEKINSFYTVLKRTEMLTVNVEELNYLAKRLDSFDIGEAAQFQAMAHKLELFDLKDLINLSFCCQQATVITDFSDLAAVGRDHYMNLHGGSASVDELNALDDKGIARQLIESGSGTVTPYGVVYDNGMKLEQVYDGRFFPCYYYKPNAITVAVTSKAEPEDTEHITWLFLPMVQEEIDRALLRGGITDPADVRLRLEDSQLPNEVDVLLDMEYETLSDLNELAEATDGLSKADMEKLGAVVMLAKPKSAAQIKKLAETLDLFDLAPGAHTPEDYGKYMIRQSGRFDYDENLDAFYDYEKYGTERMNEEDGMFTDRGYVAYKGYYSMEEVMNGGQSSRMEMGGMMYLQAVYPAADGFSPRNVRRMRAFYAAYEESPEIMRLAMNLGWTQNVAILERCGSSEERARYIRAVLHFGWKKAKLLAAIESQPWLHSPLDEQADSCYTEEKELSQESECNEKDTLCVSRQYLPQPNGRVRDEGLGEESWNDFTIQGCVGGYQPGGDRQPGLSSGAAQVIRARNRLRRSCRAAAYESRLRRIRPADRHGQREPAEYAAHLRRRPGRQVPPPDGLHRPPRRCCRPVVHRRFRIDMAGCAGGLPRAAA